MANVTINQLTALDQLALDDEFAVFDADGNSTKKATVQQVVEAAGGTVKVKNFEDGAAAGSVRGINTAPEDASYSMGQNAFAEGSGTIASGASSHAEGAETTASGTCSHAEGGRTTASALFSHAEGVDTTASAQSSHAEGGGTTASERFAHAEGSSTTASGLGAHAQGFTTNAKGNYSHAGGYETIASGNNQTVIGQYNIVNKDPETGEIIPDTVNAFVIGNGTSSNHSDAFKVTWTGDVVASGDITDGSGNVLSDLNRIEEQNLDTYLHSNTCEPATGEYLPIISKTGNVVSIYGAVKLITQLSAGQDELGVLPAKFSPPKTFSSVQATDDMNRYVLSIYPDGTVTTSWYGTTTSQAIPANKLLMVSCTYIVAQQG